MDLSSSISEAAARPLREINDDSSLSSSVLQKEKNIFLCLSWTGGKLGGACYDSENCVFRIFNDKLESSDDFYITKKLCQQIEPTNIVISSNADEKWRNAIKNDILKDFNLENEGSTTTDNEIVTIIPNKDYVFQGAKNRLELINLPQMPKLVSKTERDLYFSSFFNFECINAIKAAGALLKNLDKMKVNIELENDCLFVPILAIEVINLEDLVFIDTRTYDVLQIFHKSSHPSAYKMSNKEGLSLYGLLNRCRTTLGAKEMRKYLLRPTRDLTILESRLDAIEYFKDTKHLETTTMLENHVKNVREVLNFLKRMKTTDLAINDWKSLYKTVYSAIVIGDAIRSTRKNIPLFKKISEKFTPDLYRVAGVIEKTIDFEEAANQHHFCVKPGIDENLDEKKRLYMGLPNLMLTIANQELENLDESIQSCTVHYMPRLGYYLCIPVSQQLVEDNYHIPNLNFLFQHDGKANYKSAKTIELDIQLGDTHYEIRDRENFIMEGLQTLILTLSQTLHDVVSCCAELDCLLALASVAKEFDYVRPKLVKDTGLNITKSRHPLQELFVSSFVDNDIIVGGNEDPGKITIITGPNASGKSVYLKQVGLVVFMAHVGSFVPAQTAEIGIVDGIFTQIHSSDSVSNHLSTFAMDLNEIALSLNNARSESLVIIDEFGQGTDGDDGLALLASTINYWIRNQYLTPMVFVSTHFHSLQNMLALNNIVKRKTMEIFVNDGEEVFLFKLIDGIADKSYAHRLAAKAGIPQAVIQRSLEVTETLMDPNEIPSVLRSSSLEESIKQCDAICAALLDFDPEVGDLTALYRAVNLSSSIPEQFTTPPNNGLDEEDPHPNMGT